MTQLTHEQIEELLGAYCLDAVDADERDAIEAHLPECPRCRAEVAELREVAALLANNNTEAPEGLWDRIAEAIDDTPPPMRLDVRRRPRRDWVPILLSAAAIVTILLLGWQVLDLRRENDRIQQEVAAADATRCRCQRGQPGAARAELRCGAPDRHGRSTSGRRTDRQWHRVPAGG